MLVDLIVSLILAVLTAVFAIIPGGDGGITDLTGSEGDDFSGAFGVMLQANRVLPVAEILVCTGIALGVQAVFFLWHGAVWIYERLPFKAT